MIKGRERVKRPGLEDYINSQKVKSAQPVVKPVAKKPPPSKQDLLDAGFGPEDLKAIGVDPDEIKYEEPEELLDPPSDMEMVVMEEIDEVAEDLALVKADDAYYDDLLKDVPKEGIVNLPRPVAAPTEINLNIRVEVVNTPQSVRPKTHDILNTLQRN